MLCVMIKEFAQRFMGGEVPQLCGAGFGQVSAERTNSHNGYRMLEWGTQTGTVELAIPKLRQGNYFPESLLERRRWAERALATVVATSYSARGEHALGGEARQVLGGDQAAGVAGLAYSAGTG
jgi:putative transposase